MQSEHGIGIGTSSIVRASLKMARAHGIKETGYLVYAWRWCDDCRFAKIGYCLVGGFKNRMPITYHPTAFPFLIGAMNVPNKAEAKKMERDMRQKCRPSCTCPEREWVYIDDTFNELIDESFTKVRKSLPELLNLT